MSLRVVVLGLGMLAFGCAADSGNSGGGGGGGGGPTFLDDVLGDTDGGSGDGNALTDAIPSDSLGDVASDPTGVDASDPGTPDVPSTPQYQVVKIADDPTNLAAKDCGIKVNPGADLVYVALYRGIADPAVGSKSYAYAGKVSWFEDVKFCPKNNTADANKVLGDPSTKELVKDLNQYVSLNGGSIVVTPLDVSGKQPVDFQVGDVIQVSEFGRDEKYSVSICEDETCTKEVVLGTASGTTNITITSLQ